MLRREIGEEKFFLLLKKYFEKYKYKNVSTLDFENFAEKVSGKNLQKFFNQWVFDGKGFIELNYSYSQKIGNNGNDILLKLNQVQEGYENYNFPLDIDFILQNGEKISETIRINRIENEFNFNLGDSLKEINFDPNGWLAFKSKKILETK